MARSSIRAPSSLDRSMELLSMETELHDLLNNSQLDLRQKEAFEEMLTATFDLLQAPLSRDNHRSQQHSDPSSLIDSSSIALYSKMQGLVSSLAALIMNEDDMTRIEEGVSIMNPMNRTTYADDDSTEFSEGEGEVRPYRSLNVTKQQQQQQQQSDSTRHGLRRSVMIQSRNNNGSIGQLTPDVLSHRSSRESLRSPSFHSPKLPTYQHLNQHQHQHQHQQLNGYDGRHTSRLSQSNTEDFHDSYPDNRHHTNTHHEQLPKRQVLQLMNTPIPRSFSNSTTDYSHREMAINNSPLISRSGVHHLQRSRPTSVYHHSSSPTGHQQQQQQQQQQRGYHNHGHSLSYNETMNEYSPIQTYPSTLEQQQINRSRRNSGQSSWNGSQVGTPSQRKRYSMRF